jgi:hypothetical protein
MNGTPRAEGFQWRQTPMAAKKNLKKGKKIAAKKSLRSVS